MGLGRPRVGIVGGTGKMGARFARILKDQGLDVMVSGLGTRLSPRDAARQCQVVVVSVPVHATVDVIREVGPLVPEHGLLMDLTSVKKEPVEAMLACSRAEVVGAHPLFGPEDDLSLGLRVALTPARGRRGLDWLRTVLKEAGLKTMVMDPEEHDRLMGIVQGVHHLSTLALGLCMSRSGFDLQGIRRCSTQGFKGTLDRMEAILQQPSGLFESLLMDNTSGGVSIGHFLEAVKTLAEWSDTKDRDAFTHAFGSIKTFCDSGEESEAVPQ